MTTLHKIVLIFSLCFLACGPQRKPELEKKGNEIISQIESFRLEKGALPNSLRDLGLEEKLEGPLYYRRLDDTRYELWYGTTLGESVTYDSNRRSWQ